MKEEKIAPHNQNIIFDILIIQMGGGVTKRKAQKEWLTEWILQSRRKLNFKFNVFKGNYSWIYALIKEYIFTKLSSSSSGALEYDLLRNKCGKSSSEIGKNW